MLIGASKLFDLDINMGESKPTNIIASSPEFKMYS